MTQEDIFAIFNKVDVDARIPILKSSLLIEGMTSTFLARLLGIADYKTTKSFHGSSALSFNQKINLLIDIGALSGESRARFIKFMEIRNTFIHDVEATSFEICVSKIDGCKGWLLKQFKQNEGDAMEEQLRQAIAQLTLEIYNSTLSIIKPIHIKITSEIEAEQHQKLIVAIGKTLKELKEGINEYVARFIKANEKLDPVLLADMGDTVSQSFYTILSRETGFNKETEN